MSILTVDEVSVTDGVMSIITVDKVGVTDGVMSILTADEVGVTDGVMSILIGDKVSVTDCVMSILTVDEVGVTGGVNTYCRRGRCHRVCRTHRCGMDWNSFPLVLLVFSPALRDKTQTQHTIQ